MFDILFINIKLFILRCKMCNYNIINIYKYYFGKIENNNKNKINNLFKEIENMYNEEISLSLKN